MRGETKIFIFFFLFFWLAIIQSFVNGNIRRECRKSTGVSWVSLKKLKNGNLEEIDQKLKCYLKCFMVKNGIMTDNNEVEIENALRHLPRKLQDGSRKILEKCKTIRGETSCDTAFQIAKCYFDAHPEVLQRVALV